MRIMERRWNNVARVAPREVQNTVLLPGQTFCNNRWLRQPDTAPFYTQQQYQRIHPPLPPLKNNWFIETSYNAAYQPETVEKNLLTQFGDSNTNSKQVQSDPIPKVNPFIARRQAYRKLHGKKAKRARKEARKRLRDRLKRNKKKAALPLKMKDIILALVTRVMFGAHALIAIWRAYTEYDRIQMWLLLVPLGILILEALFTVGARGGEEYKWISPCVLLYLASVVPSVWFLEMKNFERRQTRHICNDLHWGITSLPGCNKEFIFANILEEDLGVTIANSTLRKIACDEEDIGRKAAPQNATLFTTTSLPLQDVTKESLDGAVGNVVEGLNEAKQVVDNLFQNFDIFNEQTWILVLHQLLLFFLIVGRWLLPTGEGISRDQLSQLLLVFIGVGADILEFVTETIKEIEVRCDKTLLIVIMAFWSWSTLQFSLVLTATKARRTRAVGIYEGEGEDDGPVVVVEEEEKPGACMKFLKNMEVWGILSTLILQDGPFLGTRLYIMVGRGVVHQMIVFFTTKNALVVILQLYRLSIIAFHKAKEDDDDDDDYDISALGALQGAMLGGIQSKDSVEEEKENGGENITSASPTTSEKNVTELFEVKETKKEEDEISINNTNNSNRYGISYVNVSEPKYA